MLFKKHNIFNRLLEKIYGRRYISDWARRQVNDPYVRQAQKDGYRCRSAYKLLQIDDKFKIFRPGQVVMECGCSPGSWSQVAARSVNAGGSYNKDFPAGYLVGCDLLNVKPVQGAFLLSKSDFTDENVQKRLTESVDNKTFDLVLSDMAPNASGQKDFDHHKIINLAKSVTDFTLNKGTFGTTMVIKIWQGSQMIQFTDLLKSKFTEVRMFKPKK